MRLTGKHIGLGITASHCTYSEVSPQIEELKNEGAEVTAFATYSVLNTVTRFGDGKDWVKKIEQLTGNEVVDSIVKAEPFGPKTPLDCMVMAPLTGNSLSRFRQAQNDSAVLMAAKATLRNNKPVVIGISTNDGLGLNAPNIFPLLSIKNIYFIPFGQDDPVNKPQSLVAKMSLLTDTVVSAINGEQLQPVIIENFNRTADNSFLH